MLTKQEFETNNRTITLQRLVGDTEEGFVDVSTIEIEDDRRPEEYIAIELDTPVMRKLVKILEDSPFIFSEYNKEK